VKVALLLGMIPVSFLLLGMAAMPLPPIPTVPRVDLQKFMGDWYVIANIPTSFEKGAYNATESYRLDPDGTIATTFRYRKGGFDGPLKTMRPKGFVRDTESNAVWGMQFLWPFRSEYLIAYVSPDYAQTIIARSKRDYVWIMARTPAIPDADEARLVEMVGRLGYDTAKLQRVPQRW
jgi:apolipoprotein D and lipocalin family protein